MRSSILAWRNPLPDREAWQATVYRVTKNRTLLKQPWAHRGKTFFCLWQLYPCESWVWRWPSCWACRDPGGAKCAGTQTAASAGVMALSDPAFPQSVSAVGKLPYPSPSEGRQTENHNHRKLTNLITWNTALSDLMKPWAMPCRATQDGSRWRVLTRRGPLEKGMANHFSILASRTPWTVWKGKNTGHWKMNSPGR